MSFKYAVLSLLALCMVILFGIKNYETWTQPIEIRPKFETGKQSERITSFSSVIEEKEDTGSIQSYRSIAEKNIFSSERKDFPVQASEGNKTKIRPQVILYGVTIFGDYQAASIEIPGVPHKKGERELVTRKIGDRVGEYKLAKILSDRITLESEGDSFDILLYDSKMPKKRTLVKTETQTITSPTAQPHVPAPTPREPTSTPSSATPRIPTGAKQPALPQIVKEKPMISSPRESTQEGGAPPSLPIPTKSSDLPPGMTLERSPSSSFPGSPGSPGGSIKAQPDFIPPEGRMNKRGQ